VRPPGNGHDTTTPPPTTYRDATTGLHLQSATTGGLSLRIARSSRGPLSPPPRQGTPDASWSRYDVAGSTVYTAETRETAYAEVLAYTKRRLGQRDPLAEDAAAIGLSLDEFTDLVGQEWSERQHMGMGHLPASWRIERLLYSITLPAQGWWIDVEHPDSIAAIETALEPDLAALNVGALTVAALRGEDRRITTTVACWAHGLLLDNDTLPLGITYGSKHGTGRCWAYWLTDTTPPGLACDDGAAITETDADLRRVTGRFRIRVW